MAFSFETVITKVMELEFVKESVVRGHLVYKEVWSTVEPLNKGQVGSTTLVCCREVVPFSEVVLFAPPKNYSTRSLKGCGFRFVELHTPLNGCDYLFIRVWLPVCLLFGGNNFELKHTLLSVVRSTEVVRF